MTNQSWFERHWWKLILGFLFIGIPGSFVWPWLEEARQEKDWQLRKEKLEIKSDEITGWETLPIAKRPEIGVPPRIHDFEKFLAADVSDEDIRKWVRDPYGETEIYGRLVQRAEYLFTLNPSLIVQEEAGDDIRAGRASVVVTPQEDLDAAFCVDHQDGELKPLFFIYFTVPIWDPADPPNHIDSEAEVLHAMTVVEHEVVHYSQYLDLGDPGDYYCRDYHKKDIDEAHCELLWSGEHKAYTSECQLQYAWGSLEDETTLCEAVADPAAFNQRLFKILLDMYREDRSHQICLKVWAAQAGHPHPEIYAPRKKRQSAQ